MKTLELHFIFLIKQIGNFGNLRKRRAEMMMHDCVPGMVQPLYGFVTQVMLVVNETCQLNITCTENGEKIQTELDDNDESDGGGRPMTQNTTSRILRRKYYISTHNIFQTQFDRQTGEEFTSSGPPRCRASSCRK